MRLINDVPPLLTAALRTLLLGPRGLRNPGIAADQPASAPSPAAASAELTRLKQVTALDVPGRRTGFQMALFLPRAGGAVSCSRSPSISG